MNRSQFDEDVWKLYSETKCHYHPDKLMHVPIPLNRDGQVYLVGFSLFAMNSTDSMKIAGIKNYNQNLD